MKTNRKGLSGFRFIRKKINTSKRSFRFQLITSFVLISVLPLFLIQTISAYFITDSMSKNIDEIIDLNLVQTRKSLDLTFSSYEDFLYQIYTNDEIIENMNNINGGHEIAVNVNQLRRHLRSFSNAKPSVQCVTLITSSGQLIAYDKLTPVTFESSWLNKEEEQKIYKNIATSNDTVIIETGDATQFGVNPYYLFHMAHRMIDYKHIYQDVGIIIISLDESVLAEACNESISDDNRSNLNFIVDDSGKIISFPDRARIGKVIDANRAETFQQLIEESGVLNGDQIAIHTLIDDVTGWTIVNASDQSEFYGRIYSQQRLTILVGVFAAIIMVMIILPITRRLSGSITRVVKAMSTAGAGELTVRIDSERPMPMEIQKIADQFNSMIHKISLLIDEVKEATVKQKEAEIRALESQINPHFLYNTLDTINWMAMDKDEHEISSMINSLAKILRYGVDKSNAIVTLREEVEWLRQYIYLQQTRLKKSFECKTDIDESIMGCRIHKLLLQPFVENSILHGFSGKKGRCILKISIKDRDDHIEIKIEDNGIGMSQDMVKKFNDKELRDENLDHIGIENVQSRMEMYYGEKAGVYAASSENGTCITLRIAKL